MTTITSIEPQEYPLKLSEKIFFGCMGIFLLGGISFMALNVQFKLPAELWFVLLPFSILAIICLATLRRKISIRYNEIICRGLFRTTTIPIDMVQGYRPLWRNFILEPAAPGYRSINIGDTDDYANGSALEQWLLDNFKNLNPAEKRIGMRQMLSNPSFGQSPAKRKRRYRLARTISAGYNLWGSLAAFIIILFQIPGGNALLLLPLAGLLLMYLSRGMVSFYTVNERDWYPGIFIGLFLTSTTLLFHAAKTYSLVNPWALSLPVLAVDVPILLLLYKKGLNTMGGYIKLQVVMMFITAFVYGAGIICQINGYFDRQPANIYAAIVQDRHISKSKGMEYFYFELGPWGNVTSTRHTAVSRLLYREKQVGDTVTMVVKKGLLGLEWFWLHK